MMATTIDKVVPQICKPGMGNKELLGEVMKILPELKKGALDLSMVRKRVKVAKASIPYKQILPEEDKDEDENKIISKSEATAAGTTVLALRPAAAAARSVHTGVATVDSPCGCPSAADGIGTVRPCDGCADVPR